MNSLNLGWSRGASEVRARSPRPRRTRVSEAEAERVLPKRSQSRRSRRAIETRVARLQDNHVISRARPRYSAQFPFDPVSPSVSPSARIFRRLKNFGRVAASFFLRRKQFRAVDSIDPIASSRTTPPRRSSRPPPAHPPTPLEHYAAVSPSFSLAAFTAAFYFAFPSAAPPRAPRPPSLPPIRVPSRSFSPRPG